MAYCTLDELKKHIDERELIQLTDDANFGVIDTEKIDEVIADADAEIDGYLAARYPVPLTPVPPVINKLAVDITLYNLYCRRMGPPEHRETNYKNAIRFLEKVAKDDIRLGPADPAPTTVDTAAVSCPEMVFNTEKLERY